MSKTYRYLPSFPARMLRVFDPLYQPAGDRGGLRLLPAGQPSEIRRREYNAQAQFSTSRMERPYGRWAPGRPTGRKPSGSTRNKGDTEENRSSNLGAKKCMLRRAGEIKLKVRSVSLRTALVPETRR